MSRLMGIRRVGSQRGVTLVEVSLAMAVGLMALSFVGYVALFSTKSEEVLFPQMSRQMEACRSLQAMSDLLANAKWSSIVITGDNRVDFESIDKPSGQISRIWFQDSKVIYRPNASSSSQQHVLAANLVSLSFSKVSEMVQIEVVFKYRKNRGYNSSEAQRMNGTFATRVYPRNR
jgi:prepilin-type N-terminal cleavage/methylation domain-containing protein